MRQPGHQQILIGDDSAVGAVRRVAARLATGLGATTSGVARAELVGTELSMNLLRHAEPGGWMLLRPLPPDRIELIAVDRGPGIRELAAALAGKAPAPTGLGCGLASVGRASCLLDVHTEPGVGTIVLSVVEVRATSARCASVAGLLPGRGGATTRAYGGVSVGLSEACGDGWAVVDRGDTGCLVVAVVDGVGHGAPASAAADVVLEVFGADPADLSGFLSRANEAARGTRGAVATVCLLDPNADTLRSVAVGNVNGRVVVGGTEKGLVTYGGNLGLAVRAPSARPQDHPWLPGTVLVVWTDGLRSRLDLTSRGQLFERDPAVIAAALHRDHARGTDDATVVVVRRARTG